jgi:hypothetical protein
VKKEVTDDFALQKQQLALVNLCFTGVGDICKN